MRLEDVIFLGRKYDVANLQDVLLKGVEVREHLKQQYPICPNDWYETETYRRIKVLCKTGYFNRELDWDCPDNHKG